MLFFQVIFVRYSWQSGRIFLREHIVPRRAGGYRLTQFEKLRHVLIPELKAGYSMLVISISIIFNYHKHLKDLILGAE